MKLRSVCLLAMAVLLALNGTVFADDIDTEDALRQIQARIEVLEKKVAEQDAYIKSQDSLVQKQQQKIVEYESKLSKIDDKLSRSPVSPDQVLQGLDIGVGATMIVQGANNVNAGENTLKDDRADGSYSADITIGKEFEESDSRAFLHLEAGKGNGLEDDIALYSNVNRDADDDENAHLTELWYEQDLLEDRAVLAVGKLDPTAYFDNNEAANDETSQFLGRIFRNSPTIEFPDNTAGLRMAYSMTEWMELGYGIFDANSDWEKLGDNLFNIGQINFKPNLFNLPSNYRIIGWHNNYNHIQWSDADKTKEAAYGFGLSFDQKVTDSVTLFTRYGWQDPEVYNPDITATGDLNYSLEHSWSAGVQVEGANWGRANDVLGFAIGQIYPSDDYKNSDASLNAKPEGHLEAYYKICINDHFSISPDLQYIWNPFGKDINGDEDNVFVAGMRAQLDF